jgi:hypothetical protein
LKPQFRSRNAVPGGPKEAQFYGDCLTDATLCNFGSQRVDPIHTKDQLGYSAVRLIERDKIVLEVITADPGGRSERPHTKFKSAMNPRRKLGF